MEMSLTSSGYSPDSALLCFKGLRSFVFLHFMHVMSHAIFLGMLQNVPVQQFYFHRRASKKKYGIQPASAQAQPALHHQNDL